MKPNLFVTGASGFVGGRVLDRIDPEAWDEIHLLARSPLDLPASLAHRAHTLTGGLSDTDVYRGTLDERTIVMHLAATVGTASPEQHRETNVEGTRTLLAAAERAGVRRFLHVSTIAVTFGDISDYPYALTKREAEDVVSKSGIEHVIARPTIVLGPDSPIWDRFKSLATGPVLLVPGSGRARIQPIWVDDLAVALLRLATAPAAAGRTIELGGPEPLTMEEFLRQARRGAGKGDGPTVRIPLGPVLGPLRLVERATPLRLPVSAGQFASFVYDGVADADDSAWPADYRRTGVAEMIERLS